MLPQVGIELRYARAEEAEACFCEDCRCQRECCLHHYYAECVGRDVQEQNAPDRRANGSCRLDELLLAQAEDLPPYEPDLARRAGNGQGDDDIVDAAAKQCNEREREQDGGECEQAIYKAHQDVVEDAEVACE